MLDQLNQFLFKCFQSFVLGLIQGLTEFLPISSTAHLKIVPYFIGWNDPGISISASLQLGSAFAVIYYFRNDISNLIKSFFTLIIHRKIKEDDNTRLAKYVFIATIPILFVGLIIKLFWIDFYNSNLRGLSSIAIISILMSILLAISEFCGRRNKGFMQINIIDVVFIGISQTLAIIPGVSRSGITLTSALLCGFERRTAAKFSFLIGIPAISISGIVEFLSLCRSSTINEFLPILIGIFSSYLSSIIAIDFLLRFLVKNNTYIFVFYRLAFGLLILLSL